MSHTLKSLLDGNEFIRSKTLDGYPNITAYNFTRQAFFDNHWDEQTITARGLFIDDNDRIIGRGYKKFFELNHDHGFTVDGFIEAAKNDGDVILVKHKYNGFLAIVTSLDGHTPLVLSKSGITPFSKRAHAIIVDTLGETTLKGLCAYLYANNLSATFEIIDAHDPHIIDEGAQRAIFLDVIDNTVEGRVVTTEHHTKLYAMLTTTQPFVTHTISLNDGNARTTIDAMMNSTDTSCEGVVLRSEHGRVMAKVKFPFYRDMKLLRGRIRRDMRKMRYGKPVTDKRPWPVENMLEKIATQHERYIVKNDTNESLNMPLIIKDFDLENRWLDKTQ